MHTVRRATSARASTNAPGWGGVSAGARLRPGSPRGARAKQSARGAARRGARPRRRGFVRARPVWGELAPGAEEGDFPARQKACETGVGAPVPGGVRPSRDERPGSAGPSDRPSPASESPGFDARAAGPARPPAGPCRAPEEARRPRPGAAARRGGGGRGRAVPCIARPGRRWMRSGAVQESASRRRRPGPALGSPGLGQDRAPRRAFAGVWGERGALGLGCKAGPQAQAERGPAQARGPAPAPAAIQARPPPRWGRARESRGRAWPVAAFEAAGARGPSCGFAGPAHAGSEAERAGRPAAAAPGPGWGRLGQRGCCASARGVEGQRPRRALPANRPTQRRHAVWARPRAAAKAGAAAGPRRGRGGRLGPSARVRPGCAGCRTVRAVDGTDRAKPALARAAPRAAAALFG
jgi:hypothetical protein